jgi:hypothetical protein
MELLNDITYLNMASLWPLRDESSALRVGTDSPSRDGAQFTMHVELQYHLIMVTFCLVTGKPTFAAA